MAVNKKTWLLLIAVPPFLLGLFVVGLFVYVNATVSPIHPDPKGGAVTPRKVREPHAHRG